MSKSTISTFKLFELFPDEHSAREFPEEPPVSLCIAATCSMNQFEPCVVLCCDTAGTRGDVKSEDINKMRRFDGATVLLAGNMSDARELLAACTSAIQGYTVGGDDIAITRLKTGLVEAIRVRKRAIATAVLAAESGLSYDEVFNWSQANPTDPTYVQAWKRIRELDFGAALIISTFTDDEAAILTIEGDGRIVWADHYAAVGTGSAIASAFLHQRDYRDSMGVDECLYKVLEAKVAAEKNPYVGPETVIEIFTRKARFYLKPEYGEYLTALIKRRRDELPDLQFSPNVLWSPDSAVVMPEVK